MKYDNKEKMDFYEKLSALLKLNEGESLETYCRITFQNNCQILKINIIKI